MKNNGKTEQQYQKQQRQYNGESKTHASANQHPSEQEPGPLTCEAHLKYNPCGHTAITECAVVASSPVLQHVLQHGLVGLGQHPRFLQPLYAQQQRGKQSICAAGEQPVAAAGPGPVLVLVGSVPVGSQHSPPDRAAC